MYSTQIIDSWLFWKCKRWVKSEIKRLLEWEDWALQTCYCILHYLEISAISYKLNSGY
jgi:hypothetical protein